MAKQSRDWIKFRWSGMRTAAKGRWPLWLGLALVAFGALLLSGAVVIPPRLVDTRAMATAARLQAENDLRGTLVTLLGGVIVAVGAVVGFLNYRETIQHNRSSEEQNRDLLEVQRQSQVAERFTKSIEQLGQTAIDKLDVRLGAVYALEQIAKDSKDLHWPVMEVLTAHLREYRKTRQLTPGDEATSADESDDGELPAEAQAIATVIGRRRLEHDPPAYRLDLRGVDLGRVAWHRAQLTGALFSRTQL